MKFLHTSDWHLGMSFRGNLSYEADQKYAINHICEIAEAEQVDGILIAGDVFDRSIASSEAIQMYDEIINHICCELKIPVFVIAGNHDGAKRLAQHKELLRNSGLYVAGELTREPQVVNSDELRENYVNHATLISETASASETASTSETTSAKKTDDVDIYMLPWISTEKVRAVFADKLGTRDNTPSTGEQTATPGTIEAASATQNTLSTLESAYQLVLNEYRSRFVPGHKNILIAHAFVTGANTSVSDYAAVVGNATMIGAQVFEGFDYVALGHLHGPQSINENIRYSGTPMAYSFGSEEAQEKSVTIIDTSDMSQKIIPIRQRRKRTTLKGTYDVLMKADYPQEVLDGYVRLEVTDCYVGMDSIALFREKYKNLIEISSKGFDRADEKITMTIDEFEQADKDPKTIFTRYCEDILEEKPSEHMMNLFDNALDKYVKESII